MKRKLWILLIVLAGLLVLNGIGSWAARQGTFLDGRFLTRHVFAIDPENVSRIVFREGDTLEENPVEGQDLQVWIQRLNDLTMTFCPPDPLPPRGGWSKAIEVFDSNDDEVLWFQIGNDWILYHRYVFHFPAEELAPLLEQIPH